MSIILVATPGAADANTYCTAEEDSAYQQLRLHNTGWVASGDVQARSLVMATMLLDAHLSMADQAFYKAQDKRYRYAWTGQAADGVQALAWPRIGMVSRNGYPIPANVIPVELKRAVSEFAGQIRLTERTLDLDQKTQGLKSLSAGPVSMVFKDNIEPQVVPDAVINLLVPSWIAQVIAPMSVMRNL